MIDIENEIYNEIAEKVKGEYPDAYITSSYVRVPPKFPAITVIQTDNYVLDSTRSAYNTENHAVVTFDVNVYTNTEGTKKAEGKAIMSLIDGIFASLNFTRLSFSLVSNVDETYVCRLTARYRAVISKDNVIYRR